MPAATTVKGTFQEYGLLASHYAPRPGEKITPADGVVNGLGLINGRSASIIADDFTVFGGSIDPTNMFKRMRVMQIARKEKVPYNSD